MSKKDPKTRFVCKLRHQLSELFSVHERPSGGLVLVMKAGEVFTPAEIYPHQKLIKTQKYSIHRSNGGVDTTIHHTLLFDDGEEIDTSAFLVDSSSDLIWPLYVRACPSLVGQGYAAKPRPKDRIIIAASMQQHESTLAYAVIVSSKQVDLPSLLDPRPATARFQYFDISAVCMYLWIPPIPEGTLVHMSTNTPRVNREHAMDDLSDLPDRRGLSPLLLKQSVDSMFEQVRIQHVQKIRAYVGAQSLEIFEKMRIGGFFREPPKLGS